MKVILFGVGKYLEGIERVLRNDVEVLFYVDNNEVKQKELRNGKRIYSLKELSNTTFDYIIISAYNYKLIEKQLLDNSIGKEKIIPFFKENLPFEDYSEVFQTIRGLQYSLECQLRYHVERIDQRYKLLYDNMLYELADMSKRGNVVLPKVCTVEETCEKLIKDKVSLSRYGDGEFQIILGAAKDVYQDDDEKLGQRLKEILVSNLDGHIVALADDYGCMEGRCEANKNGTRKYMTKEKRMQHYQYIDMEKQYYNNYISRPYVSYPHDEREKAAKRFYDLQKIWQGQRLLFVEGDCTRMGVGNDLFSNAESIERIIAPNKNAFTVYDEILSSVLELADKEQLILIALGPTATVLAYDLAKEGYWAIDIGHLDLEYEWYLKGEGFSYISNKYNNEVPGDTVVEDIHDESYETSIIKTVTLKS